MTVPTDCLPIPAENVLRVIAIGGRFHVVCRKHGALTEVDSAAAKTAQERRPPCPLCVAEMFDE